MDSGGAYGRGRRGGGERGRGRGRGGGGGGRGRGNQPFNYQPPPSQQQQFSHQQPQQQRQQQLQPQAGPGNPWGIGSGSGRGRPAWGPANEGPSRGPQQMGRASGPSGSYAAKLQQSSSSESRSDVPRTIVPKMESLKIAQGTSQSSTTETLQPVKRPDNGGLSKIGTVSILVNHFPVRFNPETIIRHYNIDVKPENGRPVKMSKSTLSMLKDQLFADYPDFQLEMTAYDGEKSIFSVSELPTGQFEVRLSDEENSRTRLFIFTVNLVNELKLHKLKSYLTKELLQLPRDVLQGVDVVMKENPRRHMVSIGRTFHPRVHDSKNDLGGGIVASRGFQHSLRPTSQGLALCLDYSVLAVRKRIPVLQFLEEHVYGFNINMFQKFRQQTESALKGLKVTVIHRRTKQRYVVSGLTDRSACDLTFPAEDPTGQLPPRSVRLLDYFHEKYPEVNIKHPNIPCLNLGKGGRANYVPMEFCVLVEGQRYPKEDLDFDAAAFLKKMSLASPDSRKNTICSMLRDEHGPSSGEISKNFGIDVGMNMTRVKGRVLRPPQLMLGALDNGKMSHVNVNVDKNTCQWNLVQNLVVEGKSLLRWAVLDFSYNERPVDRLNDHFIPMLIARCKKLGLHMEEPLFTEGAKMRSMASADSLLPLLERVKHRACQAGKGNLQLLLCVMTRKDPGYKHIKWISETKVGIVTQCCISRMANKGQDQYLANLGMKINAKLGGINVDLARPLPLFEDNSHVMLIGADVNHPRASDLSSPSIAAIVASTNGGTKYIERLSFQQHRSEKIIDFGNLCLELIESYEKIHQAKPQRLVIFRDGVSEGQFNMVLHDELLDLKRAMQKRDYFPTVTLVVAQKRHHTRLFPESKSDAGKNGNVPPGTVVDTTIVHPFEFDFYLCSHHGSIGTSKPTHYYVLWDEHDFSSDRLQKFIYELCFTFARCCKPVSLVPPVYYADLLAYRGRLYYDAVVDKQLSSGRSSSSSATSSSSPTSGAFFDESLYRLHSSIDCIENGMFFI